MIEVGIGLVEYDQERIAEYRTSKPDALALAGRKARAALSNSGGITLRQCQNHFVRAG